MEARRSAGAASDETGPSSAADAIERVLRRDRAVVVAALAGTIFFAWAWLFLGAGMEMGSAGHGAGAITKPAAWGPGYAALMVVMWATMMVAMMLPSAAPMILLFAAVERRRAAQDGPFRRTTVFAAAYVFVWAAFSLAAAGAQWHLERTALLSPMMRTGSGILAGALFLAAGLYQLTPLKQACLRQCRSPLEFLARHWKPGYAGALAMGVRHGAFCVGCCWVAMALLFVGGVMNLLWIAALASFVLVEKCMPAGHVLGRGAGVVLIAWGAATLFVQLTAGA